MVIFEYAVMCIQFDFTGRRGDENIASGILAALKLCVQSIKSAGLSGKLEIIPNNFGTYEIINHHFILSFKIDMFFRLQ